MSFTLEVSGLDGRRLLVPDPHHAAQILRGAAPVAVAQGLQEHRPVRDVRDQPSRAGVGQDEAQLRRGEPAVEADLGFGRILASELEVPNILENMVWNG